MLPPPPAAPLAVTVPTNAAQVATIQREAEELATLTTGTAVTTPEEYELVDATLTEIVRKRDAMLSMRGEATGPMYKAIKVVEGWFRPVDKAFASAIADLKGALGAYRLEQAKREREARELAAKAAETGDADTMITALTTAATVAAPPPGAARVALRWVRKRIAEDMLDDAWWCPDLAKIDAFAKAHKGDEPPVIPGVIFERTADVGAKH